MTVRGLFNPRNAAPDTGGQFKEGFVRVDESSLAVVQDPGARRGPYVALKWVVTRLDEDQNPLEGPEGDAQVESLLFGLGGRSLSKCHPAKAESPDDDGEAVEDLGEAIGTEGNTICMLDKAWQIHPKSALMHLMASIDGKVKEAYLDRVWAPDWKGCILYMKSLVTDDTIKGDDGKDRPISYKVVDRVVRGPGEGAKAKVVAGKSAGAKKPVEGGAEDVAAKVMAKLAEARRGETLTAKSLGVAVGQLLTKHKVDPKLHVPIITLIKSLDWVKKGQEKFGYVLDEAEGTITFAGEDEDILAGI
jgi:hypothetical protein